MRWSSASSALVGALSLQLSAAKVLWPGRASGRVHTAIREPPPLCWCVDPDQRPQHTHGIP